MSRPKSSYPPRDTSEVRYASPKALLDTFCCEQVARIETKLWGWPWGGDTGMLRDDRFTPVLRDTVMEVRGNRASTHGDPGRIDTLLGLPKGSLK